jgi:hypothetical protein
LHKASSDLLTVCGKRDRQQFTAALRACKAAREDCVRAALAYREHRNACRGDVYRFRRSDAKLSPGIAAD